MTGAWASSTAPVRIRRTRPLQAVLLRRFTHIVRCGAGTIYFKNMLVQDGNTLGSWPGPGNGLYMFNPIYVQTGGTRDTPSV